MTMWVGIRLMGLIRLIKLIRGRGAMMMVWVTGDVGWGDRMSVTEWGKKGWHGICK